MKFREYKGLDLYKVNLDILKEWEENNTFDKSLTDKGKGEFIFFEGPPSANGKPGIHHVISRTIKDIICRFRTMEGYLVKRKAGWDTHGLPVELGVEKSLGITKEDIGSKITVAEYNATCRKEVMKFTDMWEELTDKMGYWVNMDDPYITYDNRYIETLWWLLRKLYDKGLLYKGYTIQPYSPAAGTGLSSHELNLPGCYKDVKDTTCTALFRALRNEKSAKLFEGLPEDAEVNFMAWTTTPWTLPSNTALAVGAKISYLRVRTFNPYTGEPLHVVLAKDLLHAYFPEKNAELKPEDYKAGDKKIPYQIEQEYTGAELTGLAYEQLLPWVNPGEGAFRLVTGDFVTTEDGTGIVHIAPTFGADDYKVGKDNNIPALLVKMKDGTNGPLVDRRGRMVPLEDMDETFRQEKVNEETYAPFAGRFVKNAYDAELEGQEITLDIDIAVDLKQKGLAFRIEKQEHNYPHCWRTDKPVLYYPLDSWFIKTTALKGRMMELNDTINWKPQSTGTGRFGKWLENLVDWNLSRSRYWGTPLPIWTTEDKKEQKCIGSVAELKAEIDRSVAAGFMKSNPLSDFAEGDNSSENYAQFDLHRPFVDEVVLVSASGQPMHRESDLIDVWFDSGAMPFAQRHYPFEHKDDFEKFFPADFIAEGVDQTRGWFFTLHAIATMIMDSVSYKNIISNGLVLDKQGNKMSKSKGNAVDPFAIIGQYGSDPVRWYMMTNAQPWDNLKFDPAGIDEVKRKFFGTLYNTYSFFALYANIDGFNYSKAEVPVNERPEIDRWILSLLHSLTAEVGNHLRNYDITPAGRAIQHFVTENLSNWYVRLNRKRYWGGEFDTDKLAAYQTLYTCLETVARLMAPFAPFYAEQLFKDLNAATGRHAESSVHLCLFPEVQQSYIDRELEQQMDLAQRISSMVLGLRRAVSLKVRQPLAKIMLPLPDASYRKHFEAVEELVRSEVNVKEVEFIDDASDILVRKVKPNFKALGPKYGKLMKQIAAAVAQLEQEDIARLEQQGSLELALAEQTVTLAVDDVEILSEDIPGWQVATDGRLTVALDITVTDELRREGIAREFVNRIQNLRKDSGFEVTDKIEVRIERQEAIAEAVEEHASYIAAQTLAASVELSDSLNGDAVHEVEMDEVKVRIRIQRT